MKHVSRLKLLVAFFVFVPTSVSASEGIVVKYESGCSYYIVAAENGYVILNWYGGKNPREGDTLAGELEKYGLKSIRNITRDEPMRVFVEATGLSEDDALDRFNEECE